MNSLDASARRTVLIDTNLLLLLVVGLYRKDRISTFNRTRQYTYQDFLLLSDFAANFERRLTTPNILTETDNLMRQLGERERSSVAKVFNRLITNTFEQYQPSKDIVSQTRYLRLGLTDCVTISVSQDVVVITDDFRLSNILTDLGRNAININHIRTRGWL